MSAKLNHFHLSSVQDLVGFAVQNAAPGEMVKVLSKASFVSDQNEFYKYVEQISDLFFSKINVLTHNVYKFLIILHKDLTADIFINDFPMVCEILVKRNVEKGEVLRYSDVADIRKVTFPAIKINETDKVICCFKVGWKFALLFDLARFQEPLDLEMMSIELGKLYRYLAYQYIYNLLESGDDFEEMKRDGWFPFIELIGGDEYKTLIEAYQNRYNFEERIGKIVDSFDQTRINRITNRWWIKNNFYDKKAILQTGINAFLRFDQEGYIACIKTLSTEVEGIIRLEYYEHQGKDKSVNLKQLLQFIIEKCRTKTCSDYSLLLPMPFYDYLNNFVYANFDIKTDKIYLSRHSSSHGVAKAEDYTKIKALQMILILDQIYFYL